MATKKLSPAMRRLVHALEVYGYLDPIRDGGTVSTYVALIDRGIIRPHGRRTDPYFPATVREEVEEEAYAEHGRRAAETKAHAECPEQWMQVDEGGVEWHVRQSRQGYTIEIERGGHRFWYVRINGRTPMSASGTFEEARRAADNFERNRVHGDALEEYREVTRAARKADADAYQRELASKVTVVNVPLPSAMKIGITDADGNELVIGDVVRVDGDPTLYGTVYRGAGDDVWAIPLGSEREQRIDATRMRRVERVNGEYPPAEVSAQVWEAAHEEHLEQCDRLARERDEREAAELETEGGWGQPDGMMGTTETERAANASAVNGMARQMAARVIEMRRGVKRTCPAGHIDAPTTDGGTCAECENEQRAERHALDQPLIDAFNQPARAASTPAEARTGVSDRVAAALTDLAELRRETFRLWSAGTVGRREGLVRLDRIEAALRDAQGRP